MLTVQSDSCQFARGLVTYEGSMNQDDVDLDLLIEDYAKQEGLTVDMVRFLTFTSRLKSNLLLYL